MKDYTKIIKGAESIILAAVDSSGNPDATVFGKFPMVGLGMLKDESVKLKGEKIEIREAGGSNIQKGAEIELTSEMMEVLSADIPTIELMQKVVPIDVYLFGSQQSHKIPGTSVNVTIDTDLSGKGKRVSSVQNRTIKNSIGDLSLGKTATFYLTHRAYQYYQFLKNIRTRNLEFAFLPYLGALGVTTKGYDASKNRYVGDLFNGPIWGNAPDSNYSKILFDGINDHVDFGNILSIDSTSDLLFEMWIKVIGADGAGHVIISKKAVSANAVKGMLLIRSATNFIYLNISDGTNNTAITSTATILQNTWKHIAFAVDRNGIGTAYVNGVAGGTMSVASVGDTTTSDTLKAARCDTSYGNVEIGAVRVYNFGAGGLPSDIASIILRHYNAEKSIFGL
jgi:hypothetical protein